MPADGGWRHAADFALAETDPWPAPFSTKNPGILKVGERLGLKTTSVMGEETATVANTL
jgi:hypothetical protein